MPAHNLHEPTEATQEAVAVLTSVGWSQGDICKLLGIKSEKTLRKHYREQLNEGSLAVHAALATRAISMALAGEKTMLIFCLKTKFGWRATERPDEATPGTAAIEADTDPEVVDLGQA